ncbi:trypsin-like peptidase domain-containing protein [Candidatus Saccharibacteria bacterium]|nr:trypsin-like peptidase domain-containing protein [Candidatus Saccharibacteria bacterium]
MDKDDKKKTEGKEVATSKDVAEKKEANEEKTTNEDKKVKEDEVSDNKPKNNENAERSKDNKPRSGNALSLTLASIAIVLAGTSAVFSYLSYEKANTPLTILNSGTDGNMASFVEGSVADIVDKVSASVVSIVTEVKTTSYFGYSSTGQAAGTGIIVTSDGYVLTNKHVIDGASKISVVLDDGTTYTNVKVAAVDPMNDVAFLKIADVSGLTAATLGDSKTISVGQQVIAIGNALGQYQNSVTSGIISGTGRSLTATDSTGTLSEKLTDMIQTDAAINSGNSGGPLINAAGQVIGINTANGSGTENLGFAIPISSIKGMLSQLIEKGEASRAYIGVYSVEITPEIAKSYNLPVSEGVYVISSSQYSAVIKDSPAEKAGIRDKDIITAVNGVKVGPSGSLTSLIGEYKPSDTVQLTVIREGKEIGVNVTLGKYSS